MEGKYLLLKVLEKGEKVERYKVKDPVEEIMEEIQETKEYLVALEMYAEYLMGKRNKWKVEAEAVMDEDDDLPF